MIDWLDSNKVKYLYAKNISVKKEGKHFFAIKSPDGTEKYIVLFLETVKNEVLYRQNFIITDGFIACDNNYSSFFIVFITREHLIAL